jgi:uncharacterized protein
MNITDELQKLQQLRQSGAISEEEFDRAKAKILDGQRYSGATLAGNFFSGDAETQTRQWGMILHLSLLLGFTAVGIVAPILILQLRKDDLPGLDVHGKNAANWIISALIYGVVGVILVPVFGIGALILIVLGILTVVFPIVAGLKANAGEVWKYPGAIAFFK